MTSSASYTTAVPFVSVFYYQSYYSVRMLLQGHSGIRLDYWLLLEVTIMCLFIRWSRYSPWESPDLKVDYGWKKMVEPVMDLYVAVTDGSSVETKETALVWHYEGTDPVFGPSQAKELRDHLSDVLAKEPVSVRSGYNIVEVNPQVRQHLTISRANLFRLDSYWYYTPLLIICTLCVWAQAKTKRTSLEIPPVAVAINQV
jgi:hypothetical protein